MQKGCPGNNSGGNPGDNPGNNLVERLFHVRERGSTVRTELLAGVTSFMTMAYVIMVNPTILAASGIPLEAAVAATIWSSVIGSLLMAFAVNYPVAMAPAMGINVFFSYHVCGTLGLPWSVGLGAVFLSGLLFLLLTVTKIREKLIEAVPQNLKLAIVVGIGAFLAMLGLINGGIVVASEGTLVTLGPLMKVEPLLCCLGFVLILCLMARGIQGAVVISIVATTLLGMALGAVEVPKDAASLVSREIPTPGQAFLGLDVMGALNLALLPVILSLTIVSLFDNMGTLIGLTKKAGIMREDGHIPNLGRALAADSVGCMASGLVGTSAVGCYCENAAGIAQGGRTGLTALTVAALFMASLLFAPLVALVPSFATAPALIIVGYLMMTEVVHIDFSDMTEGFPAFLAIIMMPLTSSIASGIGFAFVSWPVIKLLTGKGREVSVCCWILAGLFVLNFAVGH